MSTALFVGTCDIYSWPLSCRLSLKVSQGLACRLLLEAPVGQIMSAASRCAIISYRQIILGRCATRVDCAIELRGESRHCEIAAYLLTLCLLVRGHHPSQRGKRSRQRRKRGRRRLSIKARKVNVRRMNPDRISRLDPRPSFKSKRLKLHPLSYSWILLWRSRHRVISYDSSCSIAGCTDKYFSRIRHLLERVPQS